MKVPAGIAVVPSCWKSAPPLTAVTFRCVTSAPSAMLRAAARPLVVCWLTVVAAPAIDGVSATGVTAIDAVVAAPVPVPEALVAPCTTNVALPKKSGDGVNRRPAFPCANVITSPLWIGVTPSCWNSAPLAIAVMPKCVTSAPSTALRESTRPLAVCVSSVVVAGVTAGASATGTMKMSALAGLPRPASVLPIDACATTCPVTSEFGDGLKRSPAAPSAMVTNACDGIGVTPSALKSVPPLMLTNLRCVTSGPSSGLRPTTSVAVTSSSVTTLLIAGGSATGVTVTSRVRANVEPCASLTVTVIVAVPERFVAGAYSSVAVALGLL